MGTTSSTAARHHETLSTRSIPCRGTYARNAISHEQPRQACVLHAIPLQFGRFTAIRSFRCVVRYLLHIIDTIPVIRGSARRTRVTLGEERTKTCGGTYPQKYTVWGAISLSASKRKRGRYGKGRIDAEPTVLFACVL